MPGGGPVAAGAGAAWPAAGAWDAPRRRPGRGHPCTAVRYRGPARDAGPYTVSPGVSRARHKRHLAGMRPPGRNAAAGRECGRLAGMTHGLPVDALEARVKHTCRRARRTRSVVSRVGPVTRADAPAAEDRGAVAPRRRPPSRRDGDVGRRAPARAPRGQMRGAGLRPYASRSGSPQAARRTRRSGRVPRERAAGELPRGRPGTTTRRP